MDTTVPYKPATIAKAFSEHIHTGEFVLKNTDTASVLEFLYIAYTDVQGRDPKKIEEGFISLEDYLRLKRITRFSASNVAFAMPMKNVLSWMPFRLVPT